MVFYTVHAHEFKKPDQNESTSQHTQYLHTNKIILFCTFLLLNKATVYIEWLN